MHIIGSPLSPYVRKVLVIAQLKGLDYALDPIVPFYGNDAFSQLSPLRRIPVLIDDAVTLTDSTVIGEYLNERYPTPALLPDSAVARARARWLEEFSDTRMGEVFIWRLFNEVAIKPAVWGESPDERRLAKTLGEEVPQILDYLESQLPEKGFLFETVSLADIAIASFFRNASFARFRIDGGRWPHTAGFVDRILGLEGFQHLMPIEDKLRRTPISRHRDILKDMGIPLTPESYGQTEPRRGMMTLG